MVSFGETRSTWFKYLPNWGRFNNRDQLNQGKKRKGKKSKTKRGKGGKQAANPLLPSLSPARGSHTLSVALSRRQQRAGACGGAGTLSLTLALALTRTPLAPLSLPARSPRSLSLSLSLALSLGVFCWRPGAGPGAPARAAAERSGTFIIGRGPISNRCHRGSIVRRAGGPRPPLCTAAAIGRRRAERCRHRSGSPFICALGRWTPHLISNQGDFSIFSLSTVRLQIWDFLLLLFY